MRTLQVHSFLVIAALTLFATAGCKDDLLQSSPPLEGRIEGFVRLGIEPVQAQVRATLVPSRQGDAAQFDVEVASNGRYVLDVPAGRYVLGVALRDFYRVEYEYSAAGLTAGESPPDTLRVDSAHTPILADFDFASLQLRIDVPPELNGEFATVILHRLDRPLDRARRASLFEYRGLIEDDIADILATGIRPGIYKLQVVLGRGDGERFWLPSEPDSSTALTVALGPNEIRAMEGATSSVPTRVQGRITGAWEELGVEVPSLSFFGLDSTMFRGERQVSADGRFDEQLYLSRPVKLLVSHYGVRQWWGGSNFDTATVFDLQPGQIISDLQFVESGALVQVTGESSGFSFTILRFYDAATMRLAAERASSIGLIAVPNLRPGNYRLQVDVSFHAHSKWAPQWHDRADDPAGARIVTIGSEGEVVQIPVVMQDGGTISGTITRSAPGSGDVRIYITPADDPSGWGSRSVSRESFTLEGIPKGRWKVGASQRAEGGPDSRTPPSDTIWYPGTADWRAARVITLYDFYDVTGIDIPLR